MGKDSNLRSRRQQIYSLPPLAAREPIQKTTLFMKYSVQADDRTRTDNLLITNQLLCQLSHIGTAILITSIGEPSDPDGDRTHDLRRDRAAL